MREKRLRILTLTDLYPDPVSPARGIFTKHQVSHLRYDTDQIVVVPIRIFPPLKLWRHIIQPGRFLSEWQNWRNNLRRIPLQGIIDGVPVFYPRYSSPPKQLLYGLWGFFAYPFMQGLLRNLHKQYHFDLVHAHYAHTAGEIALLAQRWMKVPVVLSIHGSDVMYALKQNPISAATISWTFRKSNAIIANSSYTKSKIVQHGGEPDKIKVVHLGADPPPLFNPSPVCVQNGLITLLSIGYFEERKGQAYVLRALRELLAQNYQVHYLLVGDGSQRDLLLSLASKLKITGRVSFEGVKTHDEIWSYIDRSDIFVLPSWDEAFGIAYIEALSMGKPVIGCEGEGGPEELKSLGDCIELVKPRDVASLVRALKKLMDDPERRRSMGEIGRRIVTEHFTWKKNAVDTLNIYRDVLGE